MTGMCDKRQRYTRSRAVLRDRLPARLAHAFSTQSVLENGGRLAGKPLKTHKQDLTLHWPAARLHCRRGGAPHRILLPHCTAWPAQCLQMPRSLPMQFWFFQRLHAAASEHLPLEPPATRSSRTPARRSQLSAGAFTVLPPRSCIACSPACHQAPCARCGSAAKLVAASLATMPQPCL